MQQTKKISELVDAGMRLIGLLSVLALLLSLISCGPGTGGTGTGPIEKSLAFAGTIPAAAVAPSNPCADCTEWHLALDEDAVELNTACLRFAHRGAWNLDPNRRVAEVEGTIELPPVGGMATTTPATLRLTFSAVPEQSDLVTVTLLDATGLTLAGPRALERSMGGTGTPPNPAACASTPSSTDVNSSNSSKSGKNGG